MSIKVYNEVTGEWEVRATNQAELVEIEDVTGELDTEDVEGALTTLVDKMDDIEIKVYEAEKELERIDKKATNVLQEFQYHLDNQSEGSLNYQFFQLDQYQSYFHLKDEESRW